ncbi:hypothetical protein B0H19DRAFT_1247710 [Mycena capillaripes]|nr:hypothetical protein B0H19DRAFT_1247710 [Mycena capillaripes]
MPLAALATKPAVLFSLHAPRSDRQNSVSSLSRKSGTNPSLSIGTPMLLTTTFFDIIVTALGCTPTHPAGVPVFAYNSNADVDILGEVSIDTMTLGPYTSRRSLFQISDHLIGLRRPYGSLSALASTPFWQNITSAGDVLSPEFSFWLARSSRTDEGAPGGAFTWTQSPALLHVLTRATPQNFRR